MNVALCRMFHPSCVHITCAPVPEDGDCFFSSIVVAMKDAGVETTSKRLRHLVAVEVLNPGNQVAQQTIDRWRELLAAGISARNGQLIREYYHAMPVVTADGPVERKRLYEQMMTSAYWGEQFALETLEEKLNLKIDVIDAETGKLTQKKHHSGDHWGVLTLVIWAAHYRPMGWCNRYIFKDSPFEQVIQRHARPEDAKCTGLLEPTAAPLI